MVHFTYYYIGRELSYETSDGKKRHRKVLSNKDRTRATTDNQEQNPKWTGAAYPRKPC